MLGIVAFLGWQNRELPPPAAEEHAAMPGMLSPDQMESLRSIHGAAFDPPFVSLMTMHHKGAIVMTDDIRLRLMAHATRHAQPGEIELMHGTKGLEAVESETLSLFVSEGEASANRRGPPLQDHRH